MQLTENEESIVHSRTKALKQFYLPPAADSEDIVMQGQYIAGKIGKESVPGYREEEGVASDSRTNTFDVLKLLSRASRWQGAPFYFRSGKRLEKKETRISIQFQESVPAGKGSTPNRLDIILQGEAGMRLHLQTKMGGTVPQFRPLLLEDPLVCIGDCLPEHSLLILEAIHGKRHWFLTFEEVQTAWRLLDPLQKYLEKEEAPLALYAAGTNGPAEADEWIKKDGLEWF
jgi:glucose-6-phosphate 1-dehydrogenase